MTATAGPPGHDLDAEIGRHRARLRNAVLLRLDRRVRGRVDASDVVQEACLEAARRFDDYRADPKKMSLFVWLRFLTFQKVLELHRRHLGAKRRDARREVPIDRRPRLGATSAALADRIAAGRTGPPAAAEREEKKARLRASLDRMDPIDREVLVLRHFERLRNAEVAEELGLTESAAAKRYVRALERLKRLLEREGHEDDAVG